VWRRGRFNRVRVRGIRSPVRFGLSAALLLLGAIAVLVYLLPARAQVPSRGMAAPDVITTRIGQIKLKRIPAGSFLMGSSDDDKEAYAFEKPQHRVRISKPFYLGVYEVTQAQYQAVMGSNPSDFSANGEAKDKVAGQPTDQHPVENVSWLDAVTFCNKLTKLEGRKPFYQIDGDSVRVPDWDGPGYWRPGVSSFRFFSP
jgi:hypothetical protein